MKYFYYCRLVRHFKEFKMTVLKKNTQFEYHQYNGWQIIIGQAI